MRHRRLRRLSYAAGVVVTLLLLAFWVSQFASGTPFGPADAP